jgi:hydroxymethylpyrimidine/phosphomethylpyrimidine kinase
MNFPDPAPGDEPADASDAPPPGVLVVDANDPTGAGGLAADLLAVASVGAHAMPVLTGAWVRDTTGIFDFQPLEEDAVVAQARTVLEDARARTIRVGFAGSAEVLGALAELASDYADVPVIASMPDLSWWDEAHIEAYQDAFRELLLPQVTLLVGNHGTLSRWLLPDWAHDRAPTPRELARAAAEMGTPYVLVTGMGQADHRLGNVLASAQSTLGSESVARFEVAFAGAGDTLASTVAALLATGCDLVAAFQEALQYLDRSLQAAYRVGMGQLVPDRLFWAQTDDEEPGEPDDASDASSMTDLMESPFNDTRH